MDQPGTRALTSQLADDLGWLEQHCRKRPDQAREAAMLRLTASLVRNCLGPFLDDQPPRPLHVVVVGGAGAGKSTVANLIAGTTAAEANPQAGFTRHPIAYTSTNGPLSWAGHLGFLGPLRRLTQPGPSSVDEDVYQVRRVPADPATFSLLQDFVVWDCPDMTTWAATGYVPRLLETAGLADVIVYVASDERYNDEVPTQFLQLLLDAGKPVIVCLMKMREADAPALVAHFQKEVLGRLKGGVVGTLAVPFLTREQLADPARLALKYRIPLVNQVAVLGTSPADLRRHAVRGAARFLQGACPYLLASARRDVQAMEAWQAAVRQGQVEFDARYRREYLAGEKFRRFDDAMVRLMELLELPGVGKVVSSTLWVVRTPYRLLRDLAVKAFTRPEAAALPELTMLEEALAGWLDLLRKEAARRADQHPLWAHVEKGFASGLADQVKERFLQGFRNFQLGTADEVDRTARSIYEQLEKSPALLNTLRGSKLSFDIVGIAGGVAGGVVLGHVWLYFVLPALATWMTQMLVELAGKQYVENQRELCRQRQAMLMAQYVSGPLAEWLAQ
ncbi:MAG TPA: GTPase domain-containing protein, partial [Gemmataceae bacterium]|nr:GTPase domain-containing protein [Gemmataceae bacterium]